tara:strand:+ start:1038 stop:1247 length:210 start_codon:yes stop_codon:yes gene_type:complete
MFLGILIILFILYIVKITHVVIEKFIDNNEYEKNNIPEILKSAVFTERNLKNILIPDTNTIRIMKSGFL